MMWRKPSRAANVASAVCGRITPPENVSRPSSTPRDASSTTRIVRPAATSAMTRRMALAPMSSTATASGAGLSAVMSGQAHRWSHDQVLRHLTAAGSTPARARGSCDGAVMIATQRL